MSFEHGSQGHSGRRVLATYSKSFPAIGSTHDPLPPGAIVEEPAHGVAQAGLERMARLPAELAPDLGGIDRIARVVARPVGNEFDEPFVRPVRALRQHLVEQRADRAHHLDVSALAVAADIVGLARSALREHRSQSLGVVLHMQPVAHVFPFAVDRQPFSSERAEDHQRDQLLGKMKRAVVVRAVGGERWQAMRVVPGAYEMVRCGLARGIGRVGRIGCRLAEFAGGPERSEHLVGRDVLEAKADLRLGIERAPVGECCLEQDVGSADIGRDEGRGAVDRAVDVALGGEVQHGIGPDFGEDRVDHGAVADVGLVVAMAVAGSGLGERFEVAGIGQLVDVRDLPVRGADDVANDGRADESGAARD
jgi:hypothetical protein